MFLAGFFFFSLSRTFWSRAPALPCYMAALQEVADLSQQLLHTSLAFNVGTPALRATAADPLLMWLHHETWLKAQIEECV